MTKQVKNPITFDKQVDLLKSRGCIIDDDAFCQEKLQLINYYRLSAYFLPFKNRNSSYKKETVYIYKDDKHLEIDKKEGKLISVTPTIDFQKRLKIDCRRRSSCGDNFYG